MLDWKILAASIVALLFISSIFLGGFGLRDSLSGILDGVGDYLGGSPFSGLFTAPKPAAGAKEITLLLSPKEIVLKPAEKVTVAAGETKVAGFAGEIRLSFANGSAALASSDLVITFPLGAVNITDLSLDRLELKDTKFELKPEISADAGTIDLEGFSGAAVATPAGLELRGKVGKLRIGVGSVSLDLA